MAFRALAAKAPFKTFSELPLVEMAITTSPAFTMASTCREKTWVKS
jgi:hypothetical protein